MKLNQYDKKYWHEVMFENGVVAQITNDGFLVRFDLKDVEEIMKRYPWDEKDKVWFFNETKDREIAELRGSVVVANPQIMWRHMPKIVIEDEFDRR